MIVAGLSGIAFGVNPDLIDPNSIGRPAAPAGLQIGGGVLINQRPYKGIDPRIIGIPFLMYEHESWSFKGTRFDYNLTKQGPWSIKGLLRLNTEGYESNDSSALRGMSDRNITLDAGISLSCRQQWGVVSFEAFTDILGVNDGQLLSLQFSKPTYEPFGIKKLLTVPFIGAEWRTTSLNDYYYGVQPKEALPNRPAYKASGDVNIVLGIMSNYRLNKNWSVFGMINNSWLGDEIQDSPIVNKDYAISIIGGLVYNF